MSAVAVIVRVCVAVRARVIVALVVRVGGIVTLVVGVAVRVRVAVTAPVVRAMGPSDPGARNLAGSTRSRGDALRW